MAGATYEERRGEVEAYFDRTAADAWKTLTSDAPLGRIRQTVRAGRDQMRETLLGWLPPDMTGLTLLDAGCGTGAASIEAARRGARVIAIDLSPTLVEHARAQVPADLGPGHIEFRVGDMLDPALGMADHVIAMDSFIHYRRGDIVGALSTLAARTRGSMVFTYAPRTPALAFMHVVGRLFPRGDRAPAIEPVSTRVFLRDVARAPALADWRSGRTRRITSGFYISQALELVRS